MEPEALAVTIVAGQRFFFLLGAGVSLAAGIPTDRPGETGLAWLLAVSDTGDVVQAEGKFETRDLHLPDLFPAIDKTRFRLLIRQQNWMNRNPTVTHDVLARLVREGFAVELSTTNYDPLTEKALKALGSNPDIVCSAETLDHFREAHVIVAKVHGCPYSDSNAENLLVTEDDLQRGRGWIVRMLQARMQERHCVYVGFSGNAPYVMAFVTAVVADLPRNALSSYVIDPTPIDDAFANPPVRPLAHLVAALHMTRDEYAQAEADRFFQRLGNEVARRLLDRALTSGLNDVPAPDRVEAEAVATVIRTLTLAALSYQDAYDFVERLESAGEGFQGLRQAADSVRAFFRWVLVLCATRIVRRAALVPALAYPLEAETGDLPLVIFAGNGHISSNELRRAIQEKYQKETEFRTRIGCDGGQSVRALLVRCTGNIRRPALQSLLPNDPNSLIPSDPTPFVWISENEVDLADRAAMQRTFQP